MTDAGRSRHEFDRAPDRRDTGSVKWDRYRGRDVLPLWVADMDFAAPDVVVDALQRRVAHGVFGYSNAPRGLKRAICRHLADRFDWQVDPDWLVWMPGVMPGVNACCRAFTRPGDAIMVPVPVYPPLLKVASHLGCETVRVPLRCENDRWRLERDSLDAARNPRTRVLLLCNPFNPVGRAFDRAELESIAQWALDNDVLICSDEIHADLVLEPGRTHLPIASIDPAVAERCVTMMAPSKTFNIAGLGFSFAVVSDPGLRARLRAAGAGLLPHVNLFGFEAALAAYQEGRAWLDALLDYLRVNRDRVTETIGAMPGLRTFPVEATHLSWIDASSMESPVRAFEVAGVGLSDGADFGAPGYVRLNFACPRERLEQALQRMRQAVEVGQPRVAP